MVRVLGSPASNLAAASAIRSSSSSTDSGIVMKTGLPNRLCSGSCNSSSHRSRSAGTGTRRPTPSPRIIFTLVIVGRVFHSRWSRSPRRSLSFAHEHRCAPAPRRRAGARRRGVGEGGRSGAAQGPPSRRRRPGRRRLGRAHPHHARRHRHHAARHARPSWRTSPTRCGPRPAATAGTSARCSADPDAQASNAAALTDLENGATSLLVQVGASGIDVADLAHGAQGRAARRRAGGARRPL